MTERCINLSASEARARAAGAMTLDEIANCTMPNWDGEGGFPITREAFDTTRALLDIQWVRDSAPDVNAHSNGIVVFEWERPAGEVHLEVGKTLAAFYARRKDFPNFYWQGPNNVDAICNAIREYVERTP